MNPRNILPAVAFVQQFRADAARLALLVDVPVENILGLAAHESQYGQGRIAIDNNNYFSMHAPAPLQIGTDTARGNPNIKVAKYASFYQSGQSFLVRFGDGVRGKKDLAEFAAALVKHGYNTGNAATGGRNGYAKLMVGAIAMVKVRMACK